MTDHKESEYLKKLREDLKSADESVKWWARIKLLAAMGITLQPEPEKNTEAQDEKTP